MRRLLLLAPVLLLAACAPQPQLTAEQVFGYLDEKPRCLSKGLYCTVHTFNDPDDLKRDLKVRWKRQGEGVYAKLERFQLHMEPRKSFGIPGYQLTLYGLEQSDKDRRFNDLLLIGELVNSVN